MKQAKGWERDKERLSEVCSLTLEYSQGEFTHTRTHTLKQAIVCPYAQCFPVTRRLCEEIFKDIEVKRQKLSSAKLALSSIVSRVKASRYIIVQIDSWSL